MLPPVATRRSRPLVIAKIGQHFYSVSMTAQPQQCWQPRRRKIVFALSGIRSLNCNCSTVMQKRLRILLTSAAAAALFTTAPTAYSQMYRWIDERGSVNYSDALPADRTGIRQLTMIDDGSRKVTPSERRTREILQAEGLLVPDDPQNVVSSPGPGPEATGTQDPLSPPPAASIPYGSDSSARAEAVRDPCLLSSNPRCHERHRSAYIPGRGYSPSAAREAREAQASGSGGTAGAASATLAGGAPRRAKLEAPKASTYALPPGNTLPIHPIKR